MEKGHDEKAEAALRPKLRSLVLSADTRKSTSHLTPQEVETIVNRLLLCAKDFFGDEAFLSKLAQNARQADDAFIEKIIAALPAEDKLRCALPAWREAVKLHIHSCICLDRSPDDFARKAADVVRNYLADGELVEVLQKRLYSARQPELIGAIQSYLRGVAMKQLGCKAEETKDLIQATWVKLLGQLHDFHFLSRFQVWAVTILYRTHCDEIRRSNQIKTGGRFKHVSWQAPVDPDDPTLTLGDTIATPAANPEDDLLFNELLALVSAYIEQQKDELQKKISELVLLDDAKAEEIAAELNISVKKVYPLLFKIRKKLRQDPNIKPDD